MSTLNLSALVFYFVLFLSIYESFLNSKDVESILSPFKLFLLFLL